jgi:hypothetical protein
VLFRSGANLYKQFRNAAINVDMDTENTEDATTYASKEEVASTEF